jgi:dimethylaniline monooxygenase (N-oxide forming)
MTLCVFNKKYNLDFVAFERSSDIGGLWRYTTDDYGVMKFTHINVSKYNYCYSDHQFPSDVATYPEHTEMFNYIKSYADKHELYKNILFNTKLICVEGEPCR